MTGIETIYGGGSNLMGMPVDDATLNKLLGVLTSHGVTHIDSAEVYADSEKDLGRVNAGSRFTLSTKTPGGTVPGSLHKVTESLPQSLGRMNTKQVDIFYIHWPDYTVKMEEVLPHINKLHQQGLFKRFGLSNFPAWSVQEIHDICEKNGYVKPSAYQGMYNAFSRRADTTLLPTLRKLGVAFYAWSPSGGGFFAKTPQQVQEGTSRFATDKFSGMYRDIYAQPEFLKGLEEWQKIAKEAGVSGNDLSLRWIKYNSPLKAEYGDAFIIGARNLDQLEQTLTDLEAGPLPKNIVDKIDALWETVKDKAAYDTYFKDGALPTDRVNPQEALASTK